MTELLPLTTHPSAVFTPTDQHAPRPQVRSDDPLAAGAPASGAGYGRSWLDDALLMEDLTLLSNRQVRIMSNHLFKVLDSDFPPAGTADQYEAVVEEIEHRERQAQERAPRPPAKETFRDNALYRRFELYVDGTLAAYLKYTMTGAQVNLIDGVEQAGYRDLGLDTTLMRHVVLNAHKRRLSIVPRCPMAFAFLADNPQYQALAARPRL